MRIDDDFADVVRDNHSVSRNEISVERDQNYWPHNFAISSKQVNKYYRQDQERANYASTKIHR